MRFKSITWYNLPKPITTNSFLLDTSGFTCPFSFYSNKKKAQKLRSEKFFKKEEAKIQYSNPWFTQILAQSLNL